MRCHLKHAVEDQAAASKEAVAPIPPVILDDVMGLRLDPPIERDEREAGHPAHDVDGLRETVRDAEARKGEHAVRDEIAVDGRAGFSLDQRKCVRLQRAYFRRMISTT